MLRTHAAQVDTLWDVLLPEPCRILPENLSRLDQLLAAPQLLASFEEHWERTNLGVGRPTIAMATYLRLMVVKHRTGWGYETLLREVSDSLHLRRFCLLPLAHPVPDESTVRKLTRRLGPELVDELIRQTIQLAAKERRWRPRAMRCDSTVVAADIRFPTDIGLAAETVKVVTRTARKLRSAIPGLGKRVRDRGRTVGKLVRAVGQTLRRRSGDAKAELAGLIQEAASQMQVSLREARQLLAEAKQLPAEIVKPADHTARDLRRLIECGERVAEQVRRRFAGEKISERLVSLHDLDARPVRRGKLSQPTEFGYVVQLTELTAHTRHGARGLILPPKVHAGSQHENNLLPSTVDELVHLNLSPDEAAFDGGFKIRATTEALAPLHTTPFIVGSAPARARSPRSRRRLASYRVGAEGRISHLKRSYHLGRARLKGEPGAHIWASWAIFAYDLDTVAPMTPGRR
jgi:transposase, IS5 family